MTSSDHIGVDAFGYKVNFKLYQTNSNNYVPFLHGIGERGPADGSQLSLVEKIGLPAEIKKGREYPFNVIAFQSVSSHSQLVKLLLPWVKLYFKAERILPTGLSMGGYAVYDLWKNDTFNLMEAAAIVCGRLNTAVAPTLRELAAIHFHGDKDPTVSYKGAVDGINAYNSSHISKIQLVTYPGVAHNSWIKAYGENQLTDFINNIFAKPKADTVQDTKDKIIQFVQGL